MNQELIEILTTFCSSDIERKVKLCMMHILELRGPSTCEGVGCDACYVHSDIGYAGKVINVGEILYEPRTS